MADDDARQALADAVVLWRLQAADGADELIDAATQALVDGVDSPTLRQLAGALPRESWFGLYPLVEGTAEELGMPELLEAPPERVALAVMVRRFTRGALSARDLASWAHAHFGHEGDPACEPFVVLDDMYDVAQYTGDSLEDLDARVADEAATFLAGRPSPGRADWYTTPVVREEAESAGARRSALRLFRGRRRRSR